MCRSARKKVEVKSLTKTVELREDRSLMNGMPLVARSRSDIKIEDEISVHELSCIPRSLFASDGSMLTSMDKSKLSHILRDLYKEH